MFKIRLDKKPHQVQFVGNILFQENLRALQARDSKLRLEKEEEELDERQEILAQGLNPDEELTRRKRIRQFEKDKE